MSRMLLDEQPLLVLPQLAKKTGLNEAIILQQIHYWNDINRQSKNNYKDGHHWTFMSVSGRQEQFPFWSTRTIQRTITQLEKMKLIITGNYNKLKIDRTKWYRIDYDVLQCLEQSPFGQIDAKNMTSWHHHLDKMGLPLPETNSEINSETKRRYLITENGDEALAFYNQLYKETFGTEHPPVTEKQLKQLEDRLLELRFEYDMDSEVLQSAMEEHFAELPDHNDGKVFAFLAGNGPVGPIYRHVL